MSVCECVCVRVRSSSSLCLIPPTRTCNPNNNRPATHKHINSPRRATGSLYMRVRALAHVRLLIREPSPVHHQDRVEGEAGGWGWRECDERWQGVRRRDKSMEGRVGEGKRAEERCERKKQRWCVCVGGGVGVSITGLRERGKDRCADC